MNKQKPVSVIETVLYIPVCIYIHDEILISNMPEIYCLVNVVTELKSGLQLYATGNAIFNISQKHLVLNHVNFIKGNRFNSESSQFLLKGITLV